MSPKVSTRLRAAGLACILLLAGCGGATQGAVAPQAPSLSVAITTPLDGAQITNTLVVMGTSSGAERVTFSIDSEAFQSVSGLETWDVVLEPGAMSDGAHTLTARAEGASGEVLASVSIEVSTVIPGVQQFTYRSSVDQVAMTSKLWIPSGFRAEEGEVPLVIHLHGGGGRGNINAVMAAELDARGWIGLSPDGRAWGLASQDCPWQNSSAYLDSPDPAVGPGEQDIFDAIDWAIDHLPIDLDRIYLTGFSMGGRGTYMIGLKNPDRFAAIAPMGPAIDMFEIFVRRPEPTACKEGMVGGKPGDSPFVDTMYRISSGRYLIENAYNLPVFHSHGTEDTTASNSPSESPFFHGWHITSDPSWSGCFDDPDFCFGHTPTLSELRARHPDGYDWAFLFTPVGHMLDARWMQGTPEDADIFGVPDPQRPGDLLGIYDFFAMHQRVRDPATVVFKTYTDTHRKAYWLEIDSATAWLDMPAAIRATRDVALGTLDVALARVATVSFDLSAAGLALPLTLNVEPLVEPTYDPALLTAGEPATTVIVLRGDFSGLASLTVRIDGVPIAASLTGSEITFGPIDTTTAHSVQIESR